MKHLKYHITTVTAAALLLLSSCNDWLNVTPRSEVREDMMFSTEDGYKRALNGVYIKMAQKELYGRATSMYVPDVMARLWIVPTETADAIRYRLSNFDYTYSGVESLFSDIWLNYYGAIVQLNDILAHLESNTEATFSYRNDQLIKGEALGLRAFLHLDLLRLFGPVPVDADPTAYAIPYVTEKTKDPHKLLSVSYADVLQAIEQDLSAAQNLLATSDPIMTYSNNELNVLPGPVQDDWQAYRQSRFNYYACLGTKARYFQWTGQKDSASIYAQRVIDDNKFTLATSGDYTGSVTANLTMFREQLFGIHNPQLSTLVDGLFKSTSPTFAQLKTVTDVLYESATHPNDIRNQLMIYWETKTYENSRQVYHYWKLCGSDRISTNNRVPLLRLAEMYLILMENLPLAEAKEVFTQYRTSRSMFDIDALAMADEPTRMDRVEREYCKEFYGEGQMFYYYKRQNAPAFNYPQYFSLPDPDKMKAAYVVPKPQSQLSFE